MISKISQQNIEHIFFFMMLDTAFYREKLNENRFVILIYYECRYAQFALSSVIELPRIPAYYPKFIKFIATVFKFLLLDYLTAEKECFHIGLLFTCHFFVFLILYPPVQQIA